MRSRIPSHAREKFYTHSPPHAHSSTPLLLSPTLPHLLPLILADGGSDGGSGGGAVVMWDVCGVGGGGGGVACTVYVCG